MHLTSLRRITAVCGLALALAASTRVAVAQETPTAPAAAPAALKPVAVIAIGSYEKLMQDADFIGSLVGMPGASQMAEGYLGQMTGGKGLAGLDKTKPIGVMVDMSMMFPNFAAYLPVTDQAALLAALQPLGIAGTDMGTGVTQINAFGQDAYAKTESGWMLLGMSPDGLAAMPSDPTPVLGPLVAEYDVAIQINLQNLPEPMRQQGIAAMSAAQGNMPKLESETDADFEARKAALQKQVDGMSQMMRELQSVTFGLAVGGEQQKVSLDVNMAAVPGSQMAAEMAEGASASTNFAGFAQPDAAATLSFAGKVTGSNAAQIESAIANFRASLSKSIEAEEESLRQPLRDALGEILDAVLETVRAGTVDGGAVVKMAPNSGTVVVGGLISDPKKIESGLKKLSEALAGRSSELMSPIAWGAETHGDVTFHTTQVKVADAEAKALFGEQMDLVVGLGAQSAYVAWGRGAADALKAVIDASAAAPATPVKPMELTVTLSRILEALKTVAPEGERQAIETAAGILAAAAGQDHVHVIAQPVENGMQMRFEAERGVLQVIAASAMGGGTPTALPVAEGAEAP